MHADANPLGTNGDANTEIFVYDIGAMTYTQLTNSSNSLNLFPHSNADFSRIVFRSDANHDGTNVDGNFEVFLYDMAAMTFTNVSDGTGFSLGQVIGTSRIAFASNGDMTGQNADGNFEIFLYDIATATLEQVTSTTTGDSSHPAMAGDDSLLVFESTADLIGSNADGNSEIFLLDPATDTITQLTDTPKGEFIDNNSPTIDTTGRWIAFASDGDLTGENPSQEQEIYVHDSVEENTFLVGHPAVTAGSANNPRAAGPGPLVAFDADLGSGGSGDGADTLIAECDTDSIHADGFEAL